MSKKQIKVKVINPPIPMRDKEIELYVNYYNYFEASNSYNNMII